MPQELISRDEIVALLFDVSDVARSVERIEALLDDDDGEEEEADDAGR